MWREWRSDSSRGAKWLVDRLPVTHHRDGQPWRWGTSHTHVPSLIKSASLRNNITHKTWRKDWSKCRYFLSRPQELGILDLCRLFALLLCGSASLIIQFSLFPACATCLMYCMFTLIDCSLVISSLKGDFAPFFTLFLEYLQPRAGTRYLRILLFQRHSLDSSFRRHKPFYSGLIDPVMWLQGRWAWITQCLYLLNWAKWAVHHLLFQGGSTDGQFTKLNL